MTLPTNDPIADSLSWEPLKKGGANFKTHNLMKTGPERLEYKPTTFYRIMPYIFIVIGLVAGGIIFSRVSYIGGLAFGLIFMGAGSLIARQANKPIVFDKSEGYFWKGKLSPRDVLNMSEIKTYANLDDIAALQVIDEVVRSDKSTYHSYEINLVLKNGERLNVVDYGNLKAIEQDLQTLKGYLNVEVWKKH